MKWVQELITFAPIFLLFNLRNYNKLYFVAMVVLLVKIDNPLAPRAQWRCPPGRGYVQIYHNRNWIYYR